MLIQVMMFSRCLQRNAHLQHSMFPLSAHTSNDFQWVSAAKFSLEAFYISSKCSYKYWFSIDVCSESLQLALISARIDLHAEYSEYKRMHKTVHLKRRLFP